MEEKISSLLNPLQELSCSHVEYVRHYNAIKHFSLRLQSLENLYADLYARICHLEKTISGQNT